MPDHTATWRKEMAALIEDPGRLDLSARSASRLSRVARVYPMRIPAWLAGKIEMGNPRCPLRQQLVPSERELAGGGVADPLGEEPFQVGPGLIRRFPDRLLALVSTRCPVHCRHCNRKRNWKKTVALADPGEIARALQGRDGIREVILSGGEPLLHPDRSLDRLIEAARSSPGVEIVRVHSRAPFALPSRFTAGLIRVLKRHRPLWFVTQFNHAAELTPSSRRALLRLRDAGIPVLNQGVLLRGVNDSVNALAGLGRALVSLGVKPYYLFQLDRALGTLHFQVPLEKATRLIWRLRSRYSGLLVPHLVIDLPGKEGKVPVGPSAVVGTSGKGIVLQNRNGKRFVYRERGPSTRNT